MKVTKAILLSSLPIVTFAYDDGIKPCWDVRLNDPDSFCYEAVNYPMSTPVFYEAVDRDADAQRMYMELRDKWIKGGKGSPDNHCMAIARDMYCYINFPRCDNNDNQQT